MKKYYCKYQEHHALHNSHNSTYVLFIFSFLFETFPNTLTKSWHFLILSPL